jgi:hypothetical protein
MNFEEIKKYLIDKNEFKIIEDKDEPAFYFETKELRVGVFDFPYPNTGYNGHILAEHKANFDKWSKTFYKANFPSDEVEMGLVMKDLEYISDDANKESGNSFGNLFRSF